MTAEPRNLENRIKWFLNNTPNGPGMCAQHSWHSLGGDYGNPPAWGCSDANEVYDKVKNSGRYWTGKPARGALILWRYGNNGHAAIAYDDAGTKIATTDPSGDIGGTGVESINYPEKWGGSSSSRIWTDEYNNVRFPVGSVSGEDDVKHSFLYLSTSKDVNKGNAVVFDGESSDDAKFHADDAAAIIAPYNSIGTYMVEAEGSGVVSFYKYDSDNELVGKIGKSVNGDLTIVQDLPKGYRLRVLVIEGSITSARLKADIRER